MLGEEGNRWCDEELFIGGVTAGWQVQPGSMTLTLTSLGDDGWRYPYSWLASMG